MSTFAKRRVSLVGVPMDLGSHLRGVDMGPSAIRIAGVIERLSRLGHKIQDLGNLGVPHAAVAGKGSAQTPFIQPVRLVCQELARVVEKALRGGRTPLVLGGDHSIALGSLGGLARFAQRKKQRYGVLWVDAHGDCNTAKTSPSGNIHGMPLAAALGLGERKLTHLIGRSPIIDASKVVLFGVRDLDPGERANLRRLRCHVITMREIDQHGVYNRMQEALAIVTSGTDGFHLSFDIDSLDPRFAPGVGTPVSGGLTTREAHLIMELVADTGRMVSCELAEVNPVLDQANTTAELATALLYSAFGGSIF